MGCGAYGRLSAENTELATKVTELSKEKQEWYDKDKLGLTVEVTRMSQQLTEVTAENERLKEALRQLDKSTSSSTSDDSLSRILEMDQRDGDELLRTLAQVHAQSRSEIQSTLQLSEELNDSKRTLKDYSDYFATRFQVFKSGWTAYVRDQEQTREAVGRLRDSLGEVVRTVEGKAGQERAEAIGRQRHSLEQCSNADFLDGFLALSQLIQQTQADYYTKRLEESDTSALQASLKQQNDTLSQQVSSLTSTLDQMRSQTASFRKIRQLKSVWKAETAGLLAEVKTHVAQTGLLVAEYSRKLQESNEQWQELAKRYEGREVRAGEEKRALENRLSAMETACAQAGDQSSSLLVQLETEKNQLNAQIASLTSEKEAQNAQIASLMSEKEAQNSQIALLAGEKDQLSSQLSDSLGNWDAEKTSLQAQLSALSSTSASQLSQSLEKCTSLETDLKAASDQATELNNQLQTCQQHLQSSEAQLKASISLSAVDSLISQFFSDLREAEETHSGAVRGLVREGTEVCEVKVEVKTVASAEQLEEMMKAAVTEVKAYWAWDGELLLSWKSAFEASATEHQVSVASLTDSHATEVAALQATISDLQYQLDTTIQTHYAETSALKAKIKGLNEDFDVTRKELQNTTEELEAKTAEFEDYIEVKTSEIDTMAAAQEPLTEQLREATDQLIAAQDSVKQLETEKAALIGERDYANQKLTEYMDKASQLDSHIESLQGEIAGLKAGSSAGGVEPVPEAVDTPEEPDKAEDKPVDGSTDAGSQEEFKGEQLKPGRQKGGRKARRK